MDDQADGSDNPWRQLDAMWPDGIERENSKKKTIQYFAN